MKKYFLFSLLLLSTLPLLAQTYTTPNTGVDWTLDDIVAASPSTITVAGDTYTLLENLTIAENDRLVLDTDLTLAVEDALLITVFGTFDVTADETTITGVDEVPFEGFRFEEGSSIDIQNSTISYSGGLRVLTETFSIDNCTLTNTTTGATTSATIQLSRGMPQITNNTISFNENAAIGSAANADVSAYIFNNMIEGNNQSNSNRPQINLGTTVPGEPLVILQNTIIGDRSLVMVGGIALANFVGGEINAEIDSNVIRDNRYGITILGSNASALIRNNVIEDNDTQGDPFLGGSGINLNSSTNDMDVVAFGNEFRRNLWGITLVDQASINLGDGTPDVQGDNIFSENGNSGEIYALYNNTANTISALNNCWVEGEINDLELAESVIFHQEDEATLGEVLFDPVGCGLLSAPDNDLTAFSFYPNPATNSINFQNVVNFTNVKIYSVKGELMVSETISAETNSIQFNLTGGIYFVNFSNDTTSIDRKLIVK